MILRETAQETDRVIILGHGIEYGDDGRAHLSTGGQERADRFLQYYQQSLREFEFPVSEVICTGGSSLLAHGVELPDDLNAREGRVMADYLTQNGVPHKIIEVEDSSTSTLSNFTNSMKLGFLNPEEFSERYPLGIVTHPHHQKRAADLAAPLGFISREVFAPITTKQMDDGRREFVLRSIYRTILVGAKGPDELTDREQNFFKLLAKLRGNKKVAEQ